MQPVVEVGGRCRPADPVALSELAAERARDLELLLRLDALRRDHDIEYLGDTENAPAIAGAVLGVAEVLDVVVAAEGIETEQQLEISRTLGCQLGQGHRIGRPAPATDLDDWLHAARL